MRGPRHWKVRTNADRHVIRLPGRRGRENPDIAVHAPEVPQAPVGRPLPGGVPFELRDTTPGVYLHHRSGLGEFQLSSDAVIATFIRYAVTARIIEQVPQAEHDEFDRLGYTMGGMMVFPGNRVDGKPTINAAWGCNRKISDRMDLTLECVRRYRHETALSPWPRPVRRLLRPVRGFPGLR